jgi:hypothetical protein
MSDVVKSVEDSVGRGHMALQGIGTTVENAMTTRGSGMGGYNTHMVKHIDSDRGAGKEPRDIGALSKGTAKASRESV